jgi:hypothetical protein
MDHLQMIRAFRFQNDQNCCPARVPGTGPCHYGIPGSPPLRQARLRQTQGGRSLRWLLSADLLPRRGKASQHKTSPYQELSPAGGTCLWQSLTGDPESLKLALVLLSYGPFFYLLRIIVMSLSATLQTTTSPFLSPFRSAMATPLG